MSDKPEKTPLIIIPLAKVVLKSGWYYVPALFWIIVSIYGAGLTLKGISMAVGLSIAWFIAMYATFGTAVENDIDKHES